ncbi:MAG: nitroreductase family protein [Dehalococcoidia bacterium]
MEAFEAILGKRDTRAYATTPLPEDAVRRILQAGRMAGSAKALEPVRAVAVRERAQLAALAACGNFTPHVPGAALAVALVLVPEEGMPPDEFAPWRGPFDAGRAAQNMMLAAWELGVTSCPFTVHQHEQAREVLGLPPGHRVINAVAFGYPDPAGRDPMRGARPRMPLEDYVHWERW